MNVITSSEFRANQRKYFDLAEKEPIYISRVGKPLMKISVAKAALTEEEARVLKASLQQAEEGNLKTLNVEELWGNIL